MLRAKTEPSSLDSSDPTRDFVKTELEEKKNGARIGGKYLWREIFGQGRKRKSKRKMRKVINTVYTVLH